jgi:hypothetical protein
MAVAATALGLLIVAVGLMGVVVPRSVIALVQHWQGPAMFLFAVSIRRALGVVFVARL